jgi:hypothetical protein
MSFSEFAERSQIPDRTLWNMIKRGDMHPVKVGGKRYFHYTELPEQGKREKFLGDRNQLPEEKP